MATKTSHTCPMHGAQWLAFVVVCCVVVPVHAIGATWKHVTASDDGLVNFYLDSGSIVANGSLRRARLLLDFAKLQQDPDTLIEHRSAIETVSIDCRRRVFAPIEVTNYASNMGRGRAVVKMASSQPLRHVAAATGSVDARVIDFVCKVR